MKILLRNIETAQYLSSNDWVADPAAAFDFGKTEQAIQFTREHNLQKMEIVLRYDHPVSEMVLPVAESSAGLASAQVKQGFF